MSDTTPSDNLTKEIKKRNIVDPILESMVVFCALYCEQWIIVNRTDRPNDRLTEWRSYRPSDRVRERGREGQSGDRHHWLDDTATSNLTCHSKAGGQHHTSNTHCLPILSNFFIALLCSSPLRKEARARVRADWRLKKYILAFIKRVTALFSWLYIGHFDSRDSGLN